MNNRALTASVTLATTILAATSCVIDHTVPGAPDNHGIPVTITLDPTTRGDEGGQGFWQPDYKVTSLRVLVYESRTRLLRWNYYFSTDAESIRNLSVAEGTYDFVFVANERADPELILDSDAAGGLPPGSAMQTLRAKSFSAAAFDYGPHFGDPAKDPGWMGIPMVSHYPSVRVEATGGIAGGGKVTYVDPFSHESSSNATSDWKVLLQRAGVRLDIDLTFKSAAQKADFDKPAADGGGLVISGGAIGSGVLRPVASTPHRTSNTICDKDNHLRRAGNEPGEENTYHFQLLLPERVLAGEENAPGHALTLSALQKSGTVGYHTDSGPGVGVNTWSLPRNLFLRMAVTIADSEIEFTDVTVAGWSDVDMTNEL